MEIEESRNNGFGVGHLDALSIGGGDREVATDTQDLSGANENSGISFPSTRTRRSSESWRLWMLLTTCGNGSCGKGSTSRASTTRSSSWKSPRTSGPERSEILSN